MKGKRCVHILVVVAPLIIINVSHWASSNETNLFYMQHIFVPSDQSGLL